MADTHDVIVIGAGAAGLTAAGGCALFGLKVALVEKSAMGGDCLNTGCVPSKALIAAAASAQSAATADRFGIQLNGRQIDFRAVHAYVRRSIERIAPNDSRERFEAMGVEVIAGRARFINERSVAVADRTLSAPRIVIATGSRPRVPNVPGLGDVPFLTNETLFDLTERPRHLAILGGGPIGIEMAQAFRRLGSEVTLLEAGRCLSHEDPDAATIVLARLRAEGVRIHEQTRAPKVRRQGGDICIADESGLEIMASHLLVAVGRFTDFDGLELSAAGVASGENGIRVDERRRTSNRHIFAIGDCREGPRFTHVAGHEGSVVALNIALGWPAKVDVRALPRVTYSDPELAQVGMTEAEARERFGSVDVRTAPFSHDDRAITADEAEGFVKMVRAKRRLVGVTIVGAHAGEMLLPWSLAIRGKASPFAIADAIVAYPTRTEQSKAAAFAAYKGLIFHPHVKRWAALLARLRRR